MGFTAQKSLYSLLEALQLPLFPAALFFLILKKKKKKKTVKEKKEEQANQ
jgi:hypothetical protein